MSDELEDHGRRNKRVFIIPPDSVGTGAGCTTKANDRVGVDKRLNSEPKDERSVATEDQSELQKLESQYKSRCKWKQQRI